VGYSQEQSTVTPKDQFAEYLAEGFTIPEIRKMMNLSKGAAQGFMRRLREGFGLERAI
jgi:transposase